MYYVFADKQLRNNFFQDIFYFFIDNKMQKITNCNNVTNIEVENNTNRTYIIEENFLKLIDIQFNVLWKNDRICLNPNDSYLIYTKENLSMNDFQYALFKINEGEFKILDIIQIKNFV